MGLRLAVACSSLCASRGGSERVATYLAAEMIRRGHAVLLLSSANGPQDPHDPVYGLPPGARHLCVDAGGRHADLRRLREFLMADQTDVFLSMQSDAAHLQWAMSCMGSGIPFICSERVDPQIYIEDIAWNRPGRHAVLAGADCIHELMPTYLETIPECFRHKACVIPNAAPRVIKAADPVGTGRKKLLYLARLCDQKRPLLLIRAFESLKDRFPDWDLVVWGHGPHEKKTRELAELPANRGRIQYMGICRNAEDAFAQAQIYCLPSYFEGFPNTALEAMAAGLPVVGFKSCKGMAGLVKHGENGLLAANDAPQSLADALACLMADQELRKKLGKGAEFASRAYQPEKIYDQWEELFIKMSALKNRTVMDSLGAEPMASRLTLSAAARREYLYRNFGEAMPWSFRWWRERFSCFSANAASAIKNKTALKKLGLRKRK